MSRPDTLIQKLLDYTEWRNFILVADKAKIACMNSGQNISDHFVDVNKTIPMPKGAEKDIRDIVCKEQGFCPMSRPWPYLQAGGQDKPDTLSFLLTSTKWFSLSYGNKSIK